MADDDLRSLVERGADLTNRYLRSGPGSAAGRPHLDEAITVLDRAYDRIEPGQTMRGQVAAQLGWLYGIRHLAHGGAAPDRATAVHLIDEALTFPQLPPVLQGGVRIVLGQLLLAGTTGDLRSPDAVMRMMTGGGRDVRDLDRAVSLFRQVAEGPPISAEMTSTARTLITVAEALRGMLGGPGGMDLGRMSQALEAMQNFQAGRGAGAGTPPLPDLTSLLPPVTEEPGPGAPPHGSSAGPSSNAFAEQPGPGTRATDTPIAVVDGPMPTGGPPPRPRPAPWPRLSAADLRRTTPDAIDEQVARAAALVEADDTEPGDLVSLAAALAGRHDADHGSGWGDGLDDLRAAAETLGRSAAGLPDRPPAEVSAALQLAERIDRDLPGRLRLSEAFGEVTAGMRDAGIDALVYPGPVVLDAATGRFTPGSPSAGRVVALAPVDSTAEVSYVRTAAQLPALIRRGRRPVTEAVVFVANPRGDRDRATMDALRLRRTFHPRSRGLGRCAEEADGPGTPDDVRAHLDASLLHLGCGVTAAGALELAGPAELTPAAIAAATSAGAGGVAVLPPVPAPAPLVDALLTCGFVAVIGFTDAVPETAASVVHWMLHAALTDDARSPAAAVAAVRAWLRDRGRTAPPDLLPSDCATVTPGQADALICYGV